MIFEEQFPAQRNTPVSKIDKLWHYFIAITTLITTLIITNFHLYLIQLWWQFFQNFVYGDVVYAQTWEVLTLKNCIKPP